MKLKHRELFLSSLYLGIVIVSSIYFFLFKFIYPQYKIVNGQILTTEKGLSKIEAILGNQERIEKEYRLFEQKLSSKEIKQTVSTEILQDIKSKASTAGLNVINIKPFSLKAENLYAEFDFKLDTEGQLKNLGSFLYNLDDSPYIFTIKYIQANAQTQEAPLRVQLLLSAFLAKE